MIKGKKVEKVQNKLCIIMSQLWHNNCGSVVQSTVLQNKLNATGYLHHIVQLVLHINLFSNPPLK